MRRGFRRRRNIESQGNEGTSSPPRKAWKRAILDSAGEEQQMARFVNSASLADRNRRLQTQVTEARNATSTRNTSPPPNTTPSPAVVSPEAPPVPRTSPNDPSVSASEDEITPNFNRIRQKRGPSLHSREEGAVRNPFRRVIPRSNALPIPATPSKQPSAPTAVRETEPIRSQHLTNRPPDHIERENSINELRRENSIL